jgi:curved DNA-binding protein
MTDHFNTLGVGTNATDDEIKTAYKKLAMKHHPDRGGDQAKFQQLQEAYATLSDPERRARWQQEKQFAQFGAHPGGAGGFNFSFGGADINDIFRQFTGGHPFGARQQVKNQDLRVGIELDLVSTLASQKHHINVQHANGSTKTVEIEIPRGVQAGMQMRFAGHGDQSMTNLPAGDLYVEFRVRQHPDFVINGIHLSKSLALNCIDAILGTSVKITGLDGTKFELTVPAGTQNNTRFRIPSQGLWDVNNPIKGDLFIDVSLQVPTTVTEYQLQALQQLKS